jgi:hypothetical protein
VALLQGDAELALAADPAIALARRAGVPLVSAAMSGTAVRRAAELGVGIIGSSLLAARRSAFARARRHVPCGGRDGSTRGDRAHMAR